MNSPRVPSPVSRVGRSKEEARALYDRLSAWYDLLAGSEARHMEAGLRKLGIKQVERVLEIGFGTGHALVSLALMTGQAGSVYGVDISAGMARQARRELRKAGVGDRVMLIGGDGARLPLRDAVVDAVFMSFTLELFDTPRIPLVLDECRRVLLPEGRLCVVGLARTGEGELSVRLYEWVHRRFPRLVDCRPIPVASVLEQAGFEVVESTRRSMWSLPVEIVLCRPGHLRETAE